MTRDEDLEDVQRDIVNAWWGRLSEAEKQELIDRHFAASAGPESVRAKAWNELSETQRQKALHELWFATRPAGDNQAN